jgi:hypothetical protein
MFALAYTCSGVGVDFYSDTDIVGSDFDIVGSGIGVCLDSDTADCFGTVDFDIVDCFGTVDCFDIADSDTVDFGIGFHCL